MPIRNLPKIARPVQATGEGQNQDLLLKAAAWDWAEDRIKADSGKTPPNVRALPLNQVLDKYSCGQDVYFYQWSRSANTWG